MEESQNSNPRDPHYDVVQAARSYSQIAAVLAGFAFAAIVLVVQIHTETPRASDLRDWAAAAFMVALFGCISSAFTFAVLTGDSKATDRSHATALFGGAGFAISTVFVFWGLSLLAELFLSKEMVGLTQRLFLITVCVVPAYLVFSAIDAIRIAKNQRFGCWLLLSVGLPGYLPILLAVILRAVGIEGLTDSLASNFVPIATGSFVVIVLSGGGALLVSEQSTGFRLPPIISITWILVQSAILGTLYLAT